MAPPPCAALAESAIRATVRDGFAGRVHQGDGQLLNVGQHRQLVAPDHHQGRRLVFVQIVGDKAGDPLRRPEVALDLPGLLRRRRGGDDRRQHGQPRPENPSSHDSYCPILCRDRMQVQSELQFCPPVSFRRGLRPERRPSSRHGRATAPRLTLFHAAAERAGSPAVSAPD